MIKRKIIMTLNEILLADMQTFLDDQPEAFAAYRAYHQLAADPVLWNKIKARERFIIDQQLDLTDAWEEGLAEGEARAEAKKARETARMMKGKGYSLTEIIELTGLSVSDIEHLD
jgi:hypothetical protein